VKLRLPSVDTLDPLYACSVAVQLALPPVHPVVTAIVVLAPYGLVFFGATLALGVGEASAAVARLLRRR